MILFPRSFQPRPRGLDALTLADAAGEPPQFSSAVAEDANRGHVRG